MKLVASALILILSAVLIPGERVEALGNTQTDWYSRGVMRQQTINVMTAKQKRQQHQKRQKRRPQKTQPRQKH